MRRVLMMDCGDGISRADNGAFGPYPLVTKTANYTLKTQETGKMFGVRGASGTITFTLPAPKVGLHYAFFVDGAQSITLTATSSAKINNGSANGSVTLASSLPGTYRIVCDGTGWFTFPSGTVVAGNLINQATVTVTNSQIKNLRATPKTLVAAPGAGFVLEFMSAELKLNAGANVLTESAANMAIKYTNGSGVAVSQDIECTGFIDQSAATLTNARPKLDTIVAYASAANQALVLHNIGAGEFGGNAAADATMTVVINYRTLTL